MRLMDPAPGTPVTSPYGMRVHPITGQLRMHTGSDRGTAGAIRAAHSGRVVEVGYQPNGYGHYVRILGDHFTTLYAHFRAAPLVRTGALVAAGQTIGYAGMTGAATGVHLHWELWVKGGRVDPEVYLHQSIPAHSKSRKRKNMLLIYNTEKKVFAIAGGTGAPWVEVTAGYSKTSTSELGSQFGSALQVNDRTWGQFKAQFTS